MKKERLLYFVKRVLIGAMLLTILYISGCLAWPMEWHEGIGGHILRIFTGGLFALLVLLCYYIGELILGD